MSVFLMIVSVLIIVSVLRNYFSEQEDIFGEGRELAHNMRSLGVLTGKTLQEFVDTAGQPTSYGETHDGLLVQWHATGYNCAVRFTRDRVFSGVLHEHIGF